MFRDGQPLKNQLVYAGFDNGHVHSHDHSNIEEHRHSERKMKTDLNGRVTLKIDQEGYWYLRTIHMIHSKEPGLTHTSNWATLTFEVRKHNQSDVPLVLYWVGGLLILTGLVFYFIRK